MFARTVFDGDSSTTAFVVDWKFMETDHVIAEVSGSPVSIDTVVYDKDADEATVTLDAAPATASDNVVIKRKTPVPADLADFIKRSTETLHGTSLVMGDQPSNYLLLFIMQEQADRLEVLEAA